MKYSRLTKEQFEELHKEFINFLATQSITKEEWDNLKVNKPELAEQELDIFSDLIWEGVLNKVGYVEHFSEEMMYLFKFEEDVMKLIAVKVENPDVNLSTSEGFQWLRENLMSEEVEMFNSKKDYSEDPNYDKFKLIEQGGNITKGELFDYFEKLIAN
ncbi:DUF6495 family protein [Aegicerativicinus sediminis]|uniref:DUF6495 family protein n=1 Tax=Aegicerativicinus sediminis TaxID=2893202 RepID=UPI001E2FF370|nr:DUF6495 family protein [Aegicerativicinus sediminis]